MNKLLTLGVLLLLGFLGGVGSAQDTTSVVEAHGKIRNSVVSIKVVGYSNDGEPKEFSSTGFIINKNGYVATVYHALGELNKPSATYRDDLEISAQIGAKYGAEFPLQIVRQYPERDFMILSLPDANLKLSPVCLTFDQEYDELSSIGTQGFPIGIAYTKHQGKIQGKFGPDGKPGLWQTSLPLNAGQSGSPIYDDAGLVMGIAVGSLNNAEGLHFFQPLAELKSEIQQYASCASNSSVGPPEQLEDDVNIPVEITEKIRACVSEEIEIRRRKPFKVEGGARCPGGGCFGQSSSCNYRHVDLEYSARPYYEIDIYRFVSTGANDAQNGPLRVFQEDNKILGVKKKLACHPSTRIGADGGWSRGFIEGFEIHSDLLELKAAVKKDCEAKLM